MSTPTSALVDRRPVPHQMVMHRPELALPVCRLSDSRDELRVWMDLSQGNRSKGPRNVVALLHHGVDDGLCRPRVRTIEVAVFDDVKQWRLRSAYVVPVVDWFCFRHCCIPPLVSPCSAQLGNNLVLSNGREKPDHGPGTQSEGLEQYNLQPKLNSGPGQPYAHTRSCPPSRVGPEKHAPPFPVQS